MLLHKSFYAPLEDAAVLQEVAGTSDSLPVEVAMDVTWARKLVGSPCRRSFLLAWLPLAPRTRAFAFGSPRVSSAGEGASVAGIAVDVISPREGSRDLVRGVDGQATHVAILSLATRGAFESQISRIVVFIECVPSRPVNGVFAVSLVVDDFHQAADSFQLQTAKLLPEIAPEQAALESINYQLLVDVLT